VSDIPDYVTAAAALVGTKRLHELAEAHRIDRNAIEGCREMQAIPPSSTARQTLRKAVRWLADAASIP
jgi:hypothetical protein